MNLPWFAQKQSRFPIYNNINPVEIYLGTNLVRTVSPTAVSPTAGFVLTLTNLAIGRYTLSAKSKDMQGREITGSSATIAVTRLLVGSLRLNPAGRFRFDIFGAVPGNFVYVETSTNLIDWLVIPSLKPPDSEHLEFIDEEPTNYPRRFYRARIGEPPPPPRF